MDNPPARTLVLLGYPDVYSAGDHVPQILKFKPIGLEGIDDLLIDYMKKKGLNIDDLKLLPQGKGWLLVEFGGKDKDDADAQANQMMAALKQVENAPSMKRYDDKEEEQQVWEIREFGLGRDGACPRHERYPSRLGRCRRPSR